MEDDKNPTRQDVEDNFLELGAQLEALKAKWAAKDKSRLSDDDIYVIAKHQDMVLFEMSGLGPCLN